MCSHSLAASLLGLKKVLKTAEKKLEEHFNCPICLDTPTVLQAIFLCVLGGGGLV